MTESFYRISVKDRILEVGGHWDDFASETKSPRAMSKHVCGRSIWDCISGLDTQSYLNAIFFWVRRRNEMFQSSYRCDSQDRARLFRMTILPDHEEDGGLVVWHTQMWSQKMHEGETVVPLAPMTSPRCSVCCRFKIGEDWVDPVFSPSSLYFPSGYQLCPSCKAALLDKLQSAGSIDRTVVPMMRGLASSRP